MDINLNIITLNIPFPPDYGGMIDSYNRIRILHKLGVRIHLHCFEYGRTPSSELELLCESVSYHTRRRGLIYHLSSLPYIVSTRKSKQLLAKLLENDYPILFDGLHTTYYISHPALSKRMKLVRAHNIEHMYYKSLSFHESSWIKKLFYLLESTRLKRYEKVLKKSDYILTISVSDQEYFRNNYNHSVFIAPFHPFAEFESIPGHGDYILFHGDLSVAENAVIANSLISEVFSKIPYPCIIAGKDPSKQLINKAFNHQNIQVISNPDDKEMKRLIIDAHIHLLPALSKNGFKLKTLIALFAGRHCLLNSLAAAGTTFGSTCHVEDTSERIIEMTGILMKEPFTNKMVSERKEMLSENYDNLSNGRKLIKLLCHVQ